MTKSNHNPPITMAIVGAGKRGEAYAEYALQHPDKLKIVAVAEPRKGLRQRLAERHAIPAERCFDGWESFSRQPRLADAVAICTQDQMHRQPVEALAPLGYAILLEKPMATTPDECEAIIASINLHGNIFAVCHVLLYTPLTQKLRQLVQSGVIGEIVNIQHLEPLAWWNHAHAYVRGNWSKEAVSSFMLLAKSCHDIDWIKHMVNRPCRQVASFGSLHHFKPSEKPAGASDRCWTCPVDVETRCPYSAKRIYHANFGRDWMTDYINDVITDGVGTPEAVEDALQNGPYGRCVYACDNDVVDNQTVMLEFDGPVTATFTMIGFAPTMHRQTRIFGTRGYLETDFVNIKIFDFTTEKTAVHSTDVGLDPAAATEAGGHGGGDHGIMAAFIHAVATGDTSAIHSGPADTLASHRIVFAAEQARRDGRVIEIEPCEIQN